MVLFKLMRYSLLAFFITLCLEGVGQIAFHALLKGDPVSFSPLSLRVTDNNTSSPNNKAVICTRGYGGFANFMFGLVSCYAISVLLHRPMYCIISLFPHE